MLSGRLVVLSVLLLFEAVLSTRADTAVGLSGLYFTGQASSGGLTGYGSADQHWQVTYATTNGGATEDTTYEGAAVVAPQYLSPFTFARWEQATWITAPGTTNNYGVMPGRGDTGQYAGIYVYTLAFQVIGNASAQDGNLVTNNISISLTIAADDNFKVYLNPAGNGDSLPTSSDLSAGGVVHAYESKTAIVLTNSGSAANAQFKIGTNYLVVVVNNTDQASGVSGWDVNSPSGLNFYQSGNQFASIDGTNVSIVNGSTKIIPETGCLIPGVGVLALLGCISVRRRRTI